MGAVSVSSEWETQQLIFSLGSNWESIGQVAKNFCSDKCVDDCRARKCLHTSLLWVGLTELQKPRSLSPTDWTVVTLKCFSPVGPFCSGESEIWAVELSKYKSISRQIRMTLTWWLTPWDDTWVTCATQSSSGPRLIIKRNHWVVQQSRTQFFWEIRFFSLRTPASHFFLMFSLHWTAQP